MNISYKVSKGISVCISQNIFITSFRRTMKLINRISLELFPEGQKAGVPVKVTSSWYRPFLDGGYKSMINSMMESGCFDEFMRSVISQLLKTG